VFVGSSLPGRVRFAEEAPDVCFFRDFFMLGVGSIMKCNTLESGKEYVSCIQTVDFPLLMA